LDFTRCESEWPNYKCNRSWGSRHPTTLNWAIADGSVQAINNDVDLDLLMAMASIDGRETVQLP
jgi:hypothetical protein